MTDIIFAKTVMIIDRIVIDAIKNVMRGGRVFQEKRKNFVLKNVEQIENVAIPAMEVIREAIKLVANVEILSLANLTVEKDEVSVPLALQ